MNNASIRSEPTLYPAPTLVGWGFHFSATARSPVVYACVTAIRASTNAPPAATTTLNRVARSDRVQRIAGKLASARELRLFGEQEHLFRLGCR